jgi:hypothetical protein
MSSTVRDTRASARSPGSATSPSGKREDARTSVAALLAVTEADIVPTPRRWLERLLAPNVADVAIDDGIARTAGQAGTIVGLSASRLKRLAAQGHCPGAYREDGAKGRWRFPLPSLQQLQRAMRAGRLSPTK